MWLLGLTGAALFTFLLIRQGAPQVGAAFTSAGWWIAAVVIYHVAVPVLLDALAWWALFPKAERLSLWQLLWMRWIGESVSTLVPSAAGGGDVVRARLAALHGASIAMAAASVLVDITLGVFVQIGFTLLGLGLIVSATGHQGFVRPTLIGAVIGVLAIIGFYVVQRLGITALRIGPQIDPGVPWTFARGEVRLALALKSGNFGAPDFFERALAMMS